MGIRSHQKRWGAPQKEGKSKWTLERSLLEEMNPTGHAPFPQRFLDFQRLPYLKGKQHRRGLARRQTAQKQWPLRCRRPDCSQTLTPHHLLQILPLISKHKKRTYQKRENISFMLYHPLYLLQKPSPHYCYTNAPSTMQIAPQISASGCFFNRSPKSPKSQRHPSSIWTRTDPTRRLVSCCIIFPPHRQRQA